MRDLLLQNRQSQTLLVFIPTYQAEKTIFKVLARLNSESLSEKITQVLVIDNASSDNTCLNIHKAQYELKGIGTKIKLIRNSTNLGLGGSQKIALAYAAKEAVTAMATVHSDEQGEADKIVHGFLTASLQHPDVDVIMASRFHPTSSLRAYSRIRIFANRFFNFLTHTLTGIRITDAGCGIYCIKLAAIKDIPYEEFDSGFHFNPQFNIALCNAGLRIHEIPLEWRDARDQASMVNPLRYCLKLTRMLLAYRLQKIKAPFLAKKPVGNKCRG